MSSRKAVIYIVRHGETIGNDTKLVMHPDQDVLNASGKLQAANLANSLKDVEFDKVYTSQYPRTVETASIIISNNSRKQSVPTVVDERLREIGIDQSYGKPYSHLLKGIFAFLSSGKPLDECNIDGSEPVPSVRERTKSFFLDLVKEISQASKDQTILIVSHGACIRILLEHFNPANNFCRVKGWDESAVRITRNTGCMELHLNVLESGEFEIVFQKLHDFSHLPKEMLEMDSLTRLARTEEGKCLSGCFQV